MFQRFFLSIWRHRWAFVIIFEGKDIYIRNIQILTRIRIRLSLLLIFENLQTLRMHLTNLLSISIFHLFVIQQVFDILSLTFPIECKIIVWDSTNAIKVFKTVMAITCLSWREDYLATKLISVQRCTVWAELVIVGLRNTIFWTLDLRWVRLFTHQKSGIFSICNGAGRRTHYHRVIDRSEILAQADFITLKILYKVLSIQG